MSYTQTIQSDAYVETPYTHTLTSDANIKGASDAALTSDATITAPQSQGLPSNARIAYDTDNLPRAPYLESADAVLTRLEQHSFTVALWFKPGVAPGQYKPTTIAVGPAWALALDTDGTLTYSLLRASTGAESSIATSQPVADDWNHVVLQYDATAQTMTVYLNGLATSSSIGAVPDSEGEGFATRFQLGTDDVSDLGLVASPFSLDDTTVWGRVLSAAEVAVLFAQGAGEPYPFLGGSFNRIFQASLINEPPKPIVLGSDRALYSVTPLFDDTLSQFQAILDLIYSGNQVSRGYAWVMDNFNDKVLCAQRNNRAQYWTPPLPTMAHDLPGLPTNDSMWDGVAVFAGHALLWRDDRLKWSDKDDFTLYLPVAETAVSTALTLADDFTQPAPNGQVTVKVINPVAAVKSISLQGDAAYGSVEFGDSSDGVLTILNTGTAPVTVTGLRLPTGWSGQWAGTIGIGQSQAVILTFTPPGAGSFGGVVHVESDATQGTSDFTVAGDCPTATRVISLSGGLNFGSVKKGDTIASALVIENQGTDPLRVDGVTSSLTQFVCGWSGTITAGQRQAVRVEFTPDGAQSYTGTLTVASNATSGDATYQVKGTGVSSFSNVALFVTDMGTGQFGKVAEGGSCGGTLTIYRLDAATGGPVNVIGVTMPDGFQTDSAVTSASPISMPQRQDSGPTSKTVPFTFHPTGPGLFGGNVQVVAKNGSAGCQVSGEAAATGKAVQLSGNLAFGSVPVRGTVQAMLTIKNIGTESFSVTSISYDVSLGGTVSGTISGQVAPGAALHALITFKPTSSSGTYTGNLTVNFSDTVEGTATFPISGNGFDMAQPLALVADQFVSLEDKRGSRTYYNYYTVVSMTTGGADSGSSGGGSGDEFYSYSNLVLKLMDLTGATPSGLTLLADGRQFFTVDANESGETRIMGSLMNGPIYKVLPQGDYAYSFKERSIQSIQYTGLGSGTFFVHNEVHGEGLIAREAVCDRSDGTIVFLGHKELYSYQGGPNPVAVCQQATRQLYAELDRSRLEAIQLFHNENRKEIWVKYPVVGGFRVLIWNYVEDSATLDDYDPTVEFSALGQVDWLCNTTWSQLSDGLFWNALPDATAWETWGVGGVKRLVLLAGADGGLRVHGRVYNREGAGYLSVSETMDFDLGEPDIWKYVDVVVIGLEVKVADSQPRYMGVQVGTSSALGGYANPPDETGRIKWTAAKRVLVNGQAPVPVRINPGGAGRYLRVRFMSSDPDVQWRISSFEVHCRPGGLY